MMRHLRGRRRRNRWAHRRANDGTLITLYEGRQGRIYEYRDGQLVEVHRPTGVRTREIDRGYAKK